MELQSLLDRARDVVAQRPTFDPKQRMAQAAETLNRAGTLAAQIGVAESALVAFIGILYATDADGYPANYDSATGRILIPAPWGSSGWRYWGLRKVEAFVLRRVLLSRAGQRRPVPLFAHDHTTRQWFVDVETYPDVDDALAWVRDYGPRLGEWRGLMHAHWESEAERLRTHRAR